MNKLTRLATLGGVAVAGVGLTAGAAAASTPAHHRPHGAVFVQTDEAAGNAVVVYDRAPDGSLHQEGTYPTGGAGGTLTGAVADDLASQGSLTYDRAQHLLYAVNAGSNSLTVFGVHGDRLRRLQTISSGGEFPVSVAVHGRLVVVLNARAGGSIQGYLQLGRHLVAIPSWHRALGLDVTRTPEFVNTPGQVAFTPGGHQLLVTTKANGSQIDVFRFDRFGGLSQHPVVTSDAGSVPFAIAFDASGYARVAEAGSNSVATFQVNRDGSLTLLDRVATGAAATCWIATDGTQLFVSNAGSASVTRYTGSGVALQTLSPLATGAGTIDATVSSDGRHLYVQTGVAGTVDEFRIHHDGSVTSVGSVTVPGGAGGEGIASS